MPAVKILFVRLRSLGDTVLMTPALQVARNAFPDAVIGMVSESPFHEILEGNPNVDKVIVAHGRSFLEKLRTVWQVNRFSPDIVIDLHGGSTSSFITALSGAAQRVGYASSRNSLFYNVKVPAPREIWNRPSLHTVERQLAPLKFLGWPVEPIPPLHVPVRPRSLESVKMLLKQRGVKEGFTLIHPAAAFVTKQWACAHFASLASRLSRNGTEVVATAGPGQESLLEELGRLVDPAVHILAPFRLPEFAALVSLCNLYVGNDTGPTHVAAALGKRIVVIFGSSDAGIWHPWGVPYKLLQSSHSCIPCPGYYCLHYDEPECIRSITADSVYEAVGEFL